MSADEIFQEMVAAVTQTNPRKRRQFLPGLLVAFIDLINQVRAQGRLYNSLDAFLQDFPRQERTHDGGKANTLIVATGPDTTLSIRPAYSRFEKWARGEHSRFDYPSMAPHATQAWGDYEHWLAGLVGMPNKQLSLLEQRVRAFTLDHFASHEVDASTLKREPPRFRLFLEKYDFTKGGDRSGAAYQGTVFAWVRADSPHLQVQVHKVRTGSKRIGKVGDVDARDGEILVLAAEVKQFKVKTEDVSDFTEFANLVTRHRALGLVVALSFEDEARKALVDLGLEPVTKQDLIDRVRLWDALKQRNAVQALLFYVTQVEQNKPLIDSVQGFFAELEKSLDESGDAAADHQGGPLSG
ncbi:hypothetical protein VAR608DRAFT_0299 [Variovorax sp. HW608]|nr:hypothetical protein VAR608DRAFT_0299 [Variovorax sp. HW608]